MTKRVVVVGHSDADGHAIAEQTRRNLSLIPGFDVRTVVDPSLTASHAAWTRLADFPEISEADILIFVDLMFGPGTFFAEANSLARFAASRPSCRIVIIDHHPVPEERLRRAQNVRAIYRPDVFECTIGPRSGLMVLAAICEKQKATVRDIVLPHHEVLALGLRRAAAPGGGLAGPALMSLLATDNWAALYALGEDSQDFHRLVRGRRVASYPQSDTFVEFVQRTRAISQGSVKRADREAGTGDSRGEAMPYDVGVERHYFDGNEPRRYTNEPVAGRDLEALVTLLELAAISLTIGPDTVFTVDDLIAEARAFAGEGMIIDPKDVKIVLRKSTFVRKGPGGYYLR